MLRAADTPSSARFHMWPRKKGTGKCYTQTLIVVNFLRRSISADWRRQAAAVRRDSCALLFTYRRWNALAESHNLSQWLESVLGMNRLCVLASLPGQTTKLATAMIYCLC